MSCLLASASGCGTTHRLAVGSMLPILRDAMTASYRDPDLATVEQGVPANLILIRGLCESSPGNRELHALAAQLYFSHALGFVEDQDPARAALLYAEGLRLGRAGLRDREWFREDAPVPPADALRRIGSADVPLLFWTLANWSSWVSLHLEDPAAVAQLSRIEAYLGRVIELDGGYFLGLPHVLLGAMQCYRPVLFGGDPEAGKAHFEQAFRLSGNRMLLYHVFFARYYCRQTLDEEGFRRSLEGVQSAPDDLLPAYRLFNEVAKRKAALLLEHMDEYF